MGPTSVPPDAALDKALTAVASDRLVGQGEADASFLQGVELRQGVEMRVVMRDAEVMNLSTCEDEQIGKRDCDAGRSPAVGQPDRPVPHGRRDVVTGQEGLITPEHVPIVVGRHAAPELQPNRRTPARGTRDQKGFHSGALVRVALPPELMDPQGTIDENGHITAGRGIRRRLRSARWRGIGR